MLSKIYDLRAEIESLEEESVKLDDQLQEAKSNLDYHQSSKELIIQDAIDEARESFLDDLEDKYYPLVEEAELKIEALEEEIDASNLPEETEELREARIALDNRNQAALRLATLEMELKLATSEHFVKMAYTGKSFTDEQFGKNLATLEDKVKIVKKYRTNPDSPIGEATEFLNSGEPSFSALLFYSVVNFWKIIPRYISMINFSIKRGKYLHKMAVFYHKMMFALVRLQELSDKEINEMLNELLQKSRAELEAKLEEAQMELQQLLTKKKEEEAEFEFDTSEVLEEWDAELENLEESIRRIEANILEVNNRLEEAGDELFDLEEEHLDKLQSKRSKYLTPQDERLVVIPDDLIFSQNEESLNFYQYPTALYMYEDLEVVHDFIRLTTFQLRNVMEWGVIQFKVLDGLGGEFISDMALPSDGKSKVQDIFIHTLSDDINRTIDLTYDLMVRRRSQSLTVIKEIGEFNLIQKQNDSATLPYQVLFIVLKDAPKFTEKLLQMIHIGEKAGIVIHIYTKKEHVTVDLIKPIEDVFHKFAELSENGITYLHPGEVKERLIQEGIDNKRSM